MIEFENLITVKKNKELRYIYDIELNSVQELKEYDSIECHIFLYPYSRKITSKHIRFNPYEEYVKDILTNHKSAYYKITNQFNKLFGLFLGIIIILFFLKFKPEDLLSVESIVSIFGSYMIGKDIWMDIEKILIDSSKNKKFRYMDDYYSYKIEKTSTLTVYSNLAKKIRYQINTLQAEKMDFIQHHNSQTVRLLFLKKEIEQVGDKNLHILSISIDPNLEEELERHGYMLGVKFSLNKKRFLIEKSYEIFQSIHKNSLGCLDKLNKWYEKAYYYRNTYKFGKLKYFYKDGFVTNKKVINRIE